ncbi:MAG: PorT family protein [Paludibacteraceae bacterium]|nr:PorT family protein [Paludibacteraceae bacterium]
MKHFISTCILAIGTLFMANAQEEAAPTPNRFGFGVRMGFGLSTLSGEGYFDDTDPIFNLNVGAAVMYGLSPKVDLETGLYYTKKGFYAEPPLDYEVTCNLYYLEIPVMVGYKWEVSDPLKINFMAGPYVAYGVNGKTKAKLGLETYEPTGNNESEKTESGNNESEKTINTDSFEDGFNRFDSGVKASINFTIKKDFLLGVTYEHGFANVSDTKDDAFNRTVALTLGFNF